MGRADSDNSRGSSDASPAGGVGGVDRHPRGGDPFEMSEWKPRRKRWVLLVLVAACLAGFALVWWLAGRPQPRANRVLVVLQTQTRDGAVGAWWTDAGQASGRCSDELGVALRGLGLEITRADDPRTLAELEGRTGPADLRQAAARLESGALIRGTLQVKAANALTGSDGLQDFVMAVEAVVESADGASVPLSARPVPLYQEAKTEEQALLETCKRLSEPLRPLLAQALATLPALAALRDRDRPARSLDDQVAADRLAPLFDLAARLEKARAARSAAEKLLRERDAKLDHGSLKKQLVGEFLAERYFVGAGPGDGIVAMDLPARLGLAEQGEPGYELRAEHERVVLLGPDGAVRQPLAELFNVYSYPSVSADGATVALIADHRQWSKALQVVSVPSGEVREVFHHRSHYFSSPVISPDGRYVVFWSSPSRDGVKSLEVVSTQGGQRDVLVPGEWTRMDRPVWAADSKRIYVALQEHGQSSSSLWRIDVSSAERVPLLGAAAAGDGPTGPETDRSTDSGDEDTDGRGRSSFARPAASPDGQFVALVEDSDGEQWLGRFVLASQSYERLVQATIGRIAVAPQTGRIAFETAPTSDPDDPAAADAEIAVVPADGGDSRLVTRNAVQDILAGWSRDGKRLFFHQGNRDPDGRRHDNRVYWIEP